MSAITAAQRDALVPVLRAGLRWLYDVAQPDGAVLSHHGIDRVLPALNRRLSFVPAGHDGRAIIILEVAHEEWGESAAAELVLLNGLGEGELNELIDLITGLGRSVSHRWNSGRESGSLVLVDPVHLSLREAVRRYHDGCPQHGSVFCTADGCGWYRDGRNRVVELDPLDGAQ